MASDHFRQLPLPLGRHIVKAHLHYTDEAQNKAEIPVGRNIVKHFLILYFESKYAARKT